MRPVEKGPAPREYQNYRDAFSDLESRIGPYCSYCERRLETNLAVEHIRPKSLEPALETSWENFLLGCVNCNSSKGDTPVALDAFVWPDRDNTMLRFGYGEAGIVFALDGGDQARSEALIRLVGLDKDPGNPDRDRRPTPTDLRWRSRFDNWRRARLCRDRLAANDTSEARELAVDVALGWGGFGIWITVFRDDADMIRRLVEAFAGTARDGFGPGGEFLERG
ncbi:MAG: HNH endonuclease signature motif containing protein [Verrucomicrobiales bacterium]